MLRSRISAYPHYEGCVPSFWRNSLRRSAPTRVVSVVAILAIIGAPLGAQAQQLPTGGSVAAGSATIGAPASGTLNINQSSDRAIINWNSFSVGQGGTVNFNQPSASSATLNRVTGSTPSSIAGTINAPGTVLLVNPNGIAITKDGVVNVGSFAASTLGIKDSDFMAGNYKFSGNGASADVTNGGRINVSDGGFAALLGGHVANDGIISARLGKVGLGSGELITLDLAGDGFMSVAVPTSVLGDIKDGQGRALVSNKGKIVADGGVVYLSAATAAGLLRDAVNVPGSIRANSVGTRNGKIVIGGGAGGKVRVSGRVKANSKNVAGGSVTVTGAQADVSGKISAKSKAEKGGVIIVTADQVTLGHEASLDVSGTTGGTLLIGGDYQGGHGATKFAIDPVKNALTTTVAAGATLTADGTNGDGGKIVVWSDDLTAYAGHLSAASANGKGGFAEVSGHRLLDFTGTANLTGSSGAGTLLLDPYNVVISNGVNNTGGSYTANIDDSIINVATLQAALASGNVIVTTGDAVSPGAQAGDITVTDAVTWSSANNLTLIAARNIAINAGITAINGGLVLNAVNASNSIGASGAINVGTFTLQSGHWSQTGALPAFAAGNFTIGGGSFLRVTGGDGLAATPYQIADVFGLQGIGSSSTLLSKSYVLANDIDASGTAAWNGGAGFVPIGTDGAGNIHNSLTGFAGTFDGLGHTISNLVIDINADYAGLFGFASGAIRNIGLIGGSVSGVTHVGGLVGYAQNYSTISTSYAAGAVSGTSFVGGLVGSVARYAEISASYATGAVSGTERVGGLVGFVRDHTTISASYATGAVSGTNTVGGLVGDASYGVAISASYATGTVSGTGSVVGGLVGSVVDINSTISASYATGAVSGRNYVGGLVGQTTTKYSFSPGTITESYATGAVSGTDYVGGLVGQIDSYFSGTPVFIMASYATGAVSGTDYVGGLSGNASADSTTSASYASGAVTATGVNAGGLVGKSQGTVQTSYWDMGTTGRSTACGVGSCGATGLLTANARTQASYSNLDFTNTWFMIDGQTRPFLRSEYSTTITNAHQLQLIGMNATTLAASYTLANDIDLGSSLPNASDMWGTSGFVPLGIDFAFPFSGSFDGQNHTIAGLTINRPSTNNVGLFGYISSTATLANVSLTGANVTGQNNVGGLVGATGLGHIDNASVAGTVSGVENIGGLIGYSGSGRISNSHSAATVTGDVAGGLAGYNAHGSIETSYATGDVSGYQAVGGLVGASSGGVASSYATGNVSATAGGGYGFGGLVGVSAGIVDRSYAAGTVNAGLSDYVGGLVGLGGIVTDSYATGAVTGNNKVGGLAGSNGFSIERSYASGLVTGNTEFGGLVGNNANPVTDSYWDMGTSGPAYGYGVNSSTFGATGLSTTDARQQASYAGTWDFTNTWTMVDGQTRPFLRSEYSTTITNAHQLQLMSLNTSASYTLANNINLAASLNNASDMWGTNGFVPIGGSNTFSGTLDGQGHSISGLYINQPSTNQVGLISHLYYGTVTNLAIVGANVTGGTYNVGILTGLAEGTTNISDVYTTGRVTGGYSIGGIAGFFAGDGTIQSSYSTAAVSGLGSLGGALGSASGTATVTNVYWDTQTTGQSISDGSDAAYGLTTAEFKSGLPTGFSSSVWGIIAGKSYPYLRGQFNGTPEIVSGTAYSDLGTTPYGATLITALANGVSLGTTYSNGDGSYDLLFDAGTLTGSQQFVAYTNNGMVYQANVTNGMTGLDIYANTLRINDTAATQYSTVTSGLSTAVGASGVSTTFDNLAIKTTGGFTLDQVISTAGALILDVNGSISAPNAVNVGTFVLQGGNWAQNAGVLPTFSATDFRIAGGSFLRVTGGDGSSATPYEIADVYGLQGIDSSSTLLSKSYVLANDIDASGTALWNAGAGFNPIGDVSNNFTGSFDGQNNTIAGLTINRPSTDNVGLFGYIYSPATLTNVSLTGTDITGHNSVGMLVGNVNAAGITNVAVSGQVSGNVSVGGLIGAYYDGNIDNVSATGAVSGAQNVGGLVGNSSGAHIADSHSAATVTGGAPSFVGGLVGYMILSSIQTSYATGDVSGVSFVGGLVGYGVGAITSSYATGNVTATAGVGAYFGGLVGAITSGSINRSYATGAVNAGLSDRVGGLVGANPDATIADSYATGAVTANNKVGGLAGQNTGPIARSYATGLVTGTTLVGGLVGDNANTVTDSYWDVGTSGQAAGYGANSSTFGAIGLSTPNALKLASYVGFDFGSVWGITENSAHPYLQWQYPGGPPQVISGYVYSDLGTTLVDAVTVNGLINGTSLGSVTSANGFYQYTFAPNTIGANSQIVTYTTGGSGGTVFAQNASGSVVGLDIYGGALRIVASGTTLSGAMTDLATGVGASGVPTAFNNLAINATGASFTIDQALNKSGALIVDGAGTLGATESVTAGTFNLKSGAWVQNAGVLPTFAATDFQLNGGSFLRVTGGDGSAATPYQIADVFGLQGIGSSSTLLSKSYVLANDIDASGTVAWNAGAGFNPIMGSGFRGSFDGQNHTIAGLTINRPLTDNVGLFGYTFSPGSLANVSLTGADVTGRSGVGMLVGGVNGTSISNVTVSGDVSGSGAVGGLVGSYYGGNIDNVSATGTVSGAFQTIGGLIGNLSSAHISNSHSAATVTGTSSTSFVGGLVGYMISSSIQTSYATGDVSGYSVVGGLAGSGNGSIASSYATGDVTETAAGGYYFGGLVGESNGTIAKSYATGAVNAGLSDKVGGLVGSNYAQIADSYATGAVTGDTNVGGLAGRNSRDIDRSYASGFVTGSSNVGGLVGNNANTVTNSYWDVGTSMQPAGYGANTSTFGAIGLSSADSMKQASYAGFDIDAVGGTATVWRIYEGSTAPLLRTFLTAATVTYADAGKTYDGAVYGPFGAPTCSVSCALLLGSATVTGTAATAVDAGGYAIVGSYYSAQQGYDIGYAGTLTIGQRAITVTADAGQSKTYGNADPSLAYSLTSGTLVGGDALSGAIDRAAGETVGNYAIGQGTLAASANYALTYVSDNFGITPAPLTVTADAGQGRVYGASEPTLTYGYSGLVNSDTASVFSGALSRAAGTNVGSYAIGQNTLSAGSNYTIAYTGANFAITPAPLTVTANSGQGTVYGASDPTLTYGYSGLVNSDTASVFSGALSRAAGTNVGSYAIGQNTLTAGGNYTIAYTGANFAITPAPLTVTANSGQGKVYGASDPALTYGYSGLVNSDTASVFSGALSRAGGTNVGSYAIGQNTLSAGSNYTISYTSANFAITPATLTVTADAGQGKVYGASDPTLTYGYSGLVNSDTASVFSGALSRAAGTNVGSYAIGQNTLSAGSNYTIAYAGANFAITPAPLTVTADAGQGRVYGAIDPTLTYGFSGLVNSDTASVFSGALSRAAGTNVGSYAIGQNTLTAGGNYTIAYTGANFAITPAPLTVTADAGQGKVYGASDPTLTYGYSGLVNSDTASVFSGALSRAAGTNVGSYAIGQNTLSAGSNYTIDYTGTNFAITPAALTIAAVTDNRIYDGGTASTAAPLVSGLVGGDSVTAVQVFDSRNAGARTLSVAAGYTVNDGNGGANYTVNASATATGTISPANLAVTADSGQGKVYGAADPTLTYSHGALAAGDTDAVFSGALVRAPGETVAGGPYAITQGSLSAGGNYTIAYTSATFAITPAALSLSVIADAGQNKVYGAIDPTLTYGYSGLVGGDTASVFTGALSRVSGENVGTYAITQGSLSAGANYSIDFTGANFAITPAPLTVTANSGQGTVYGATDPALTYGYSGLVNSDTASVFSGSLSRAAGTNVGSYAIGQNTLSAGSNYTIDYTGGNFAITPATLTVTADAGQGRIYGAIDPTLTYGYSGLVNSDTASVFSGALSRAAGTNVGSYAIGQNTLSAGSNYTIDYTGANFIIDPRSITVAANAQSKTYDNNAATDPALTYSIGGLGLVSGDSLAGALTRTGGQAAGSYVIGQGTLANANYTISYTSANFVIDPRSITVTANAQSKVYDNNAATDPALTYAVTGLGLVSGDSLNGSLTRAAGQNAGTYAIGQGTLANSNYAITYTGASFVIDPRSITVTANAQSKVYDNNAATDPALTYAVTGLGLVSGDSLNGALTRAADQNAGTYAIGQGTLANANYAITYTGASFIIDPRSITVAANAQSKQAGESDPAFTYTLTAGALVLGDTLSGSLTRLAGEDVGAYAIQQGTLAASPNYSISYVDADLSIFAAASADNGTTNGFEPVRFRPESSSESRPVLNVSFQIGGSTNVPTIGIVNTQVASDDAPANQYVAPAGGTADLFWPISQFDPMQYSSGSLPEFARNAGEATVLTMIARAAENNRQLPMIDKLWGNDAAGWANLSDAVADHATFSDGNGTKRVPDGDNGFAFVNGATDIAVMLANGPVMLGGAAPADPAKPKLWLLAIRFTDDAKGIVANDPLTGRQVVLAYDPATKMVGGVIGIIDRASGKVTTLGNAGIKLVINGGPADIEIELNGFRPASYFAVTM